MSGVWDISLSESFSSPISVAGNIINSPIYGMSDNSSDGHPNEFNLDSENSTSCLSDGLDQPAYTDISVGAEDRISVEESFRNELIEAEIASIRLFCEEADNNLNAIGLGPVGRASTPTIRNPHESNELHGNSQPVEVIDLSNFELNHPTIARRLRTRTPDAFIDLCSPEPAATRLVESCEPAKLGRRRLLRVPDSSEDCAGPSSSKYSRKETNDSSNESYMCPVCLESVRKREPCSTKCGHVFCKVCIETAVQTTRKCPLCNKKIEKRSIFRIYL